MLNLELKPPQNLDAEPRTNPGIEEPDWYYAHIVEEDAIERLLLMLECECSQRA